MTQVLHLISNQLSYPVSVEAQRLGEKLNKDDINVERSEVSSGSLLESFEYVSNWSKNPSQEISDVESQVKVLKENLKKRREEKMERQNKCITSTPTVANKTPKKHDLSCSLPIFPSTLHGVDVTAEDSRQNQTFNSNRAFQLRKRAMILKQCDIKKNQITFLQRRNAKIAKKIANYCPKLPAVNSSETNSNLMLENEIKNSSYLNCSLDSAYETEMSQYSRLARNERSRLSNKYNTIEEKLTINENVVVQPIKHKVKPNIDEDDVTNLADDEYCSFTSDETMLLSTTTIYYPKSNDNYESNEGNKQANCDGNHREIAHQCHAIHAGCTCTCHQNFQPIQDQFNGKICSKFIFNSTIIDKYHFLCVLNFIS